MDVFLCAWTTGYTGLRESHVKNGCQIKEDQG